MNKFLEPISRKKFVIYCIIWFLCIGIIMFFLLIPILMSGFKEEEAIALILVQNWWFVSFTYLINIILYYKRIKDIMGIPHSRFNYYYLLIIPILGFLMSINGPHYILIPAIIIKPLNMVSDLLIIAFLIFLTLKKGKSSLY